MGTRMHHSLHLRYHYHEVQTPPHLDSAWRFFYFEDWWNTKDAWTQILFFSFEDYGRTRMHEPSWTHILFPLKLGRMGAPSPPALGFSIPATAKSSRMATSRGQWGRRAALANSVIKRRTFHASLLCSPPWAYAGAGWVGVKWMGKMETWHLPFAISFEDLQKNKYDLIPLNPFIDYSLQSGCHEDQAFPGVECESKRFGRFPSGLKCPAWGPGVGSQVAADFYFLWHPPYWSCGWWC